MGSRSWVKGTGPTFESIDTAFENLEANVDAIIMAAGFSFDFTQSVASVLWVINHNLGFRPNVEVRDTGGRTVVTEVIHISANLCQILFLSPLAGTAHLS